jgi:YHS domain-containing protein
MTKNIRSIVILAALAVVLAVGVAAQQKSADTAVDPVCGMTVAKANAKGTFEFKGTTYYFCSTGCKEAFAKDPEKYLKTQAKGEEKAAPMGGGMMMHAHGAPAAAPAAGDAACACPMGSCGQMMPGRAAMRPGMPMMRRPMMMRGGMGMPGRGMMPPVFGHLFKLYGDKVELAVENTKDGAVLKVTSKDPEVAKAIQVHMAEHVAMMKKMKDAAAMAPAAGVKSPEEAACADCPMKKK